jgi:hypothetical protein
MQTGRNNPSTTRNGVQRSEVNTVMVIISNATSCQFALAQQLRQHSQKLREENTNSQPGGIRISVLGRAAGTMPHLEHTVLHTATVIYRSSVPRQSRGAAWRSSKKIARPHACTRSAQGEDDADQLAATASAARGPEPRSWRSLGAPCSMRRLPPPLDGPSTSIIERKFLTTRADGGAAVAVWGWPADASCAWSDVPPASFSCDVRLKVRLRKWDMFIIRVRIRVCICRYKMKYHQSRILHS